MKKEEYGNVMGAMYTVCKYNRQTTRPQELVIGKKI